ncbi:hypothetical protein D3C85_1678480 [compost metagenome]
MIIESVYPSKAAIVSVTRTRITVAIAKAMAVNKLGLTSFPLSENRVSITITVSITRAINIQIAPADSGSSCSLACRIHWSIGS